MVGYSNFFLKKISFDQDVAETMHYLSTCNCFTGEENTVYTVALDNSLKPKPAQDG